MSNTVVAHDSYAIIKTGSTNNLPYTFENISALTPGVDIFGTYFDEIYVKQLTGEKAYIKTEYHTNSNLASTTYNMSAIAAGKVYKNSIESDAWIELTYNSNKALISFDSWSSSTEITTTNIPDSGNYECLRFVYLTLCPTNYPSTSSVYTAGAYCGKYAWILGRGNGLNGFYYSIHDPAYYDSYGFPNTWVHASSLPANVVVDDIASIRQHGLIKGNGNSALYYSSDWYTWSQPTTTVPSTINGITSNVKDTYVATHNTGGSTSGLIAYIYKSTDYGANWTKITGITVYDEDDNIITSTSVTDGDGIYSLDSVFYNGEYYIFVPLNGVDYIYYSKDLINYYQVQYSNSNQMYDMYSNGVYTFASNGAGSGTVSGQYHVNKLVINQIPALETIVCEKNLNVAGEVQLATKKSYGLLGTNQIGQIISAYQYVVCSTATYNVSSITSQFSTIVCTSTSGTTITFPTASVDYENYHVEVINPYNSATVSFSGTFGNTATSLTTMSKAEFMCVPYVSNSNIAYKWIVV